MFRLHRNKPTQPTDVVGEKIDFTFSKIQVLQVPKGWDKLYLSLISLETGKPVKRTGKESVKNGTCRWMETFIMSICISNLDTPTESEKHIFKFLVATGFSKSNILGEATLDLAAFLSLELPILVSFPLKECDYGTILQVEIRCLTPKTNPRDAKWKEMQANKDLYDAENNFQLSDSITTKNTISYYSNKFDKASRPREHGSAETSFSSSISPYSVDSMDDSVGRDTSSSQSKNLNSPNCGIRRQDSDEFLENEPSCSYSTFDPPELDRNRRELRKIPHAREQNAREQASQQHAGFFIKFKEPDDCAEVEVLKAEAKMWEQNARKLAVDIENLRNELADQFLIMTNLNTELATSHSECRTLSQEIDRLKLLLEESTGKQNVSEKFEVLGSTSDDMQKQMEDEMRYLKELNESLSSQLKKTQGANHELVGILQEMEETMEKQKLEIDSFFSLKSVDSNSKNNCINDECREIDVHGQVSVDKMNLNTGLPEILVIRINEQVLQENKGKLNLKSQKLEELEKSSWREILYLEPTFQEKMVENEIEQEVKNLILKEFEVECSSTLAAKEQRILNLEAALSRTLSAQNQKESRHLEARKEIEHLKEEVQELETDCNKLTEENLHLLLELKELRENGIKETNACLSCLSREGSVNDFQCSSMSVEEIEKKEAHQERPSDLQDESINWENRWQSFEFQARELDIEPERCLQETVDSSENNDLSEVEKGYDFLSRQISGLEAQLRYLTDTKESSRLELEHSKSQVVILQNEILDLEEKMELQKLCMENKLLETEKRWTEAQEECSSLKKMNTRLQVTAENLMEECDSLQKFNVELRQQILLTFQDQCFVLEAEVRNFEDFVRSENIGTSLVEGKFQDSELDEAKHKAVINELESQIKYSDAERIRFEEENTFLHMQLVKVPELQNKVLALRASLKKMRSKNQFLEAELKSVSGDYEELKRENDLMAQKISSMQNVTLEAENCRHDKIVLEDNILRLEGDLMAKEALLAVDADMKNESDRVTRENRVLNLEVKNLQDVREELQKKVQCLEEELKQTKHAEECQRGSLPKENKDDFMSVDQESQCPDSDIYDSQLRSVEAETNVSNKRESREPICAANNEHKITLLEAELHDIRERYLQISLKYAEVEAQKEQLVMKVKALNTWNSFPK
ncbi:uncharacterized protein [Primulina eburnea]|uniref:uncharacterized protein n=1 Tax=Primulina eburnea TaxID=1245227 RepID=UPI003C6C21C4